MVSVTHCSSPLSYPVVDDDDSCCTVAVLPNVEGRVLIYDAGSEFVELNLVPGISVADGEEGCPN